MRGFHVIFGSLIALALLVGQTMAEEPPQDAAFSQGRSGNVLFRMPADWTRKDNPNGVTLLLPPSLPDGKWFELRLIRGEDSGDSAEQSLEKHVAAIRQRYAVLDETPVRRGKHRRGWPSASIALTVNVAPPQQQPDLRFWVIYIARADGCIEGIHYVSNDHGVYVQQSRTVERFLDQMQYANLIVLADGSPKLTELLVNETTDFFEWLLEVPLTAGQRVFIREAVVAAWKRADQKEIDAVLELVKLRRQLAAMEPAKADFARASVQPEFIAGLRQEQNALARLLVQIYDAGHKPIAAGEPPLTRQAADAMLEFIYFAASLLEGGKIVAPTAEEKDQWAGRLAEQYARMPEAQRSGIVRMPMLWAALRWSWPTLPEAEQRRCKEEFERFEPVAQVRKAIASARSAADEGFAAAMQRMQRSHESFMFLSNMSNQMHMTNMAMISNIGGGGWRYEYRYR